MTGKKTAAAAAADDRINPKEEFELAGWARRLGVTPQVLKKTVKKVGPLLADVKKELGV